MRGCRGTKSSRNSLLPFLGGPFDTRSILPFRS